MFQRSYDVGLRGPSQKDDGPSGTYGCDFCEEGGWCSETEVDLHKKTVHRRKMMELIHNQNKALCGVCFKEFSNEEKTLEHFKAAHLYSSVDAIRIERDIYICDKCNQIFFQKQMLEVHIRYSHARYDQQDPKELVNCPICHRNIKLRAVWFHFQTHKVQSVSTCRICYIKCKDRQHLEEHVKKHPKHLLCNMCHYETRNEVLFKQHVLMKHKSNKKSIGKCLEYKRYYKAPVKDLVLNKFCGFRGLLLTNDVYICILCREISSDQNSMIQHISDDHSAVPEKEIVEYHCICGEKFLNKVLLKHHVFKLKEGHAPK